MVFLDYQQYNHRTAYCVYVCVWGGGGGLGVYASGGGGGVYYSYTLSKKLNVNIQPI